MTQPQAHVVLQVVDDGPGIPVDDCSRVLEPFVRLDTARTRDTGGTGLGLAIVDEIVRAHHGTIPLDATGLTVTVRLPGLALTAEGAALHRQRGRSVSQGLRSGRTRSGTRRAPDRTA